MVQCIYKAGHFPLFTAMAVLFVDSYDLFSCNLVALIRAASKEPVLVIRNDTILPANTENFISSFSSIVIGPGPGNPNIKSDLGNISNLLEAAASAHVPVLGICLGLQAIGLNAGCTVQRLDDIQHGQVAQVVHFGGELFKGVPEKFDSVRYHLLHVLGSGLEPLAYAGDVLMAAKHASRPFYGVQYHPESICSEYGLTVIQNFIDISSKWNRQNRGTIIFDHDMQVEFVEPELRLDEKYNLTPARNAHETHFQYRKLVLDKASDFCVQAVDSLRATTSHDFMVLNGSSRGDYSIIGVCDSGDTEEITWYIEDPACVKIGKWKEPQQSTQMDMSIWQYLQSYMLKHTILGNEKIANLGLPFVGGFIGIFSYESGQFVDPQLATTKKNGKSQPDVKMVFVERTIVFNEKSGEVYVISLKEDDVEWLDFMETKLKNVTPAKYPESMDDIAVVKDITRPDKEHYISMFNKCQEYLRNGDSYELCLCSPTDIDFAEEFDTWQLYKFLSKKNPAPFSGILEFSDCALISSSPERFLSWKNTSETLNSKPDFDKLCQLRPIKGTVKKVPGFSRKDAEAILNTPKELGENLMIVDLIRHDLNTHCDSQVPDTVSEAVCSDVRVPKLMQVEEYETVYQLVSVIECDLKHKDELLDKPSSSKGFRILSTSLPPGSMTGAPKKRSVELLQKDMENHYGNRGIYSGVFGYWSVDDQSDWSVIIRLMYSYSDRTKWRIGAGGAITVLSTAEGEWEEMNVKLDSILQMFKSHT